MWIATTLVTVSILGCGGGKSPVAVSAPSPSAGQVASSTSSAQVGYYAAARFADQVSFGATPELIADLRQKGYAKWIDEQLGIPATLIDIAPFSKFIDPTPREEGVAYSIAFSNIAVGGTDQLRTRVTWSLSQFITASDRKGDLSGSVHWINLLQNKGLGNYADLLYAVALNPHMGHYLDNDQNRPKSAECPHCAPNENFARELMQLFSLGVFKLNPDGTAVRDAKGAFIETYTQRDVEELARVLTGWMHSNVPENRPKRNWGNWDKPMIPSTWPPERDSGTKTVMGKFFPAGQSTDKDLRDAVAMLMDHPNIAPFVATRLIQHLVKSNPTPQYVGRVSAKFLDNGNGVKGDMKVVVKAILLDSEARVGDDPVAARTDDGKFREPFLHYMATLRGLGCTSVLMNPWSNGGAMQTAQRPFSPDSVFSFYAPTDRAPGSNLLAPEQKLVTAEEFTGRLGRTSGARWDHVAQQTNLNNFIRAGCKADALVAAYGTSSKAFSDYLSARYFRGVMPPTLRSNIDQLIKQPTWDTRDPAEGAFRMLDFALTSPYFGVMK